MDVRAVTKDKGGTSRSLEMTVVPPSRDVPAEKLRAIAKGTGLDGVFLADALSAAATHERGAAQLARASARLSSTEGLRQLHEAIADEHAKHLAGLERLMDALGLDRMYVSPAARLTHHTWLQLLQVPLLSGSVDQRTLDCALLDLGRSGLEQGQVNARVLDLCAKHAKASRQTDALRTAAEELGADVATVLDRVRAASEAFTVAAAMGGAEQTTAAQPGGRQP